MSVDKSNQHNKKELPKKRAKITLNEVALFLLVFVGMSVLMTLFVVAGLEEKKKNSIVAYQESVTQAELEEKMRASEEAVEIVNWVELSLKGVDVSDWKEYQNSWYGFKVEYPSDWKVPTSSKPSAGSNWEYRYHFRKSNNADVDDFVGFDVAVYNASKIDDLFETDEFPYIKDKGDEEDIVKCYNKRGELMNSKEYPMTKVQSFLFDNCYEPAVFFSKTRSEFGKSYIYNVVAISDGSENENKELIDPTMELGEKFPEFFPAALSFSLIKISRPKPKPVITAPKPATYKIDKYGRMVCEKDDDKPSKSKKNKEHHLDMECCLDPDEDPNPWCYYDPAKYGKYLK